MLSWLLSLLSGCRHRHCTFPISARAGEKADPRLPRGPYVVCLDCARTFAYDWEQMKIIRTSLVSRTGVSHGMQAAPSPSE
jgi:hypothetical protein